MSKILGIDYGVKRTGISITDEFNFIACGLTTVPTKKLFYFLNEYFKKESIKKIVLGLPRTELSLEKVIQKFINEFRKKHSEELTIVRIDECFTSKLAKYTIAKSYLKRKKRMDKSIVDKISAAIILQSFLDRERFSSIYR
ncbi:MAG TPA: Holliday junction resolvase RuvX [Candidatus Angelobacter sp.]|jgi:putative Holliday junction resolvase|nr:Holliday junction resolvase RuvX [Candidatus Angelobacter sp.]